MSSILLTKTNGEELSVSALNYQFSETVKIRRKGALTDVLCARPDAHYPLFKEFTRVHLSGGTVNVLEKPDEINERLRKAVAPRPCA